MTDFRSCLQKDRHSIRGRRRFIIAMNEIYLSQPCRLPGLTQFLMDFELAHVSDQFLVVTGNHLLSPVPLFLQRRTGLTPWATHQSRRTKRRICRSRQGGTRWPGAQIGPADSYPASNNNVRVFWEGAGEPFFTQKRVPRNAFKILYYLKNR